MFHQAKLILWTLLAGSHCFAVATNAAEVSLDRNLRPLIKTHCVKCHGPGTQEGDFRIDLLTDDFSDRETAQAWLEVRDLINLGEMPPPDETPLEIEQITTFSGWITTRQRQAQRDAQGNGSRVLMRRLSRDEYAHAVADLLQIEFPPGESPLDALPPDGTAEGFNKVSAALLVDPSLMKRYYDVARRISERALVSGPPAFPTEKMRIEFEDIVQSRAISYLTKRLGIRPAHDGLVLIDGSTRSFGMLRYPGRKDNNVAPVSGSYRFTIRVGGIAGENGIPPRLSIRQSHPEATMELVAEFDVDAPIDTPKEYSFVVPRDDQGGEIKVSILPGTNLYMGQRPGENFRKAINEVGAAKQYDEVIRLRGRQVAEGAGGDRSTPDPEKLETDRFASIFIDWLEVEGPLYDQWPPNSHETLFFKSDNVDQDLDYAQEIFSRFLPRAWRRPVLDNEVQPILEIVREELASGATFVNAIRVGLTAALTSPKFIYVFEPSEDGRVRDLNDYEVASRLSFFLCSSMPDDELFRLAKLGELSDPKTLETQVDRLIDGAASDRFVDGFARQWLRTDTFQSFTPDRNVYREYDPQLGEFAVQEPLEFFRALLHDDLSVLNFIDSDFAMLNGPLAEHYGIAGVTGDEFRRVVLDPQSHRGGLLGMMGVHLAGSDGLRTKPVSRAVYVREVLLNDPPDPPPANVGEIEPNIQGHNLTVRERLNQHLEIESCASCHRQLDPYGLALENFNVVGQWRTQQDGEGFRRNRPAIVVEGRLPNGKTFSSFEQFRALLHQQDDRFRRGLAEKLWIYAMGRPVDPSDDPALIAVTEKMQGEGDTLRSLIKGIVTSTQFLTK